MDPGKGDVVDGIVVFGSGFWLGWKGFWVSGSMSKKFSEKKINSTQMIIVNFIWKYNCNYKFTCIFCVYNWL